jgi:pimeloyl-ACP methyl ester carboxylesterase
MGFKESIRFGLGRLAGVVLVALLGGFLVYQYMSHRAPDLARLYGMSSTDADATPIIVIPGIFGSKLRDRTTHEEVWPGSWRDIATGNYDRLALKFDPTTLKIQPDNYEPFEIADRVLGVDFYGPLIDVLHRVGGYQPSTPGTPAHHGEKRYYIFAYDWRQDNVTHAAELERLIDAIRRDYGDPNLKVDIVAHSMGGLIARYYLRYGTVDVLDGNPHLVTLYGTSRVRKLILLGTPNFGSASSLHAFLTGKRLATVRVLPEVIVSMPSVYQLFPHPLVTWLTDIHGKPLPDSLYDIETWKRYGWSLFDPEIEARLLARKVESPKQELEAFRRYFDARLERGRRFAWALSTKEPATPIRYVLFGGDCAMTPARLVLEKEDAGFRARMTPKEIRHPEAGVPYESIMLEPGDGQVTKPSLLARENLDPTSPMNEESFLPIAYWFFLCERHNALTSNPSFQDNLLNVILTRTLPWEMTGMDPASPARPGRAGTRPSP